MKNVYITSAFYRLVIVGTAVALVQSINHCKEIPIVILSAMLVGVLVAYLNHRKRSRVEVKLTRREGVRVYGWLV